MIRKTSASLAVLMLLLLCAPVLTYAASILQVHYNATTGEISGVIYSDQKDISLTLDQDGTSYRIPDTVMGNVYRLSPTGLYWAELSGKIQPGLKPGKAIVNAGDIAEFAPSVSDSVYGFSNSFASPSILAGFGWGRDEDGLYGLELNWTDPNPFGTVYYNLYDNGSWIARSDITYAYLTGFSPLSQHRFSVEAVDLLGRKTAVSADYQLRVPSEMKKADFFFAEQDSGYAMKPQDKLATFQVSPGIAGEPDGWYDIGLSLASWNYKFQNIAFHLDKEKLTPSDFELVAASGEKTIPDRIFVSQNYISFGFNKKMDMHQTYTLQLSATAETGEIRLPENVYIGGSLNVYISGSTVNEYHYNYFSYMKTRTVGDVTPPERPTGLKAEGDGSLRVTWNANQESDIAGYRVWLDGQLLTDKPVTATSYTIPGLINGKTYHVNVAAVDQAGNQSLQAYIFPVPAAAGSGGSSGGGGTGGGSGIGGGSGTDGGSGTGGGTGAGSGAGGALSASPAGGAVDSNGVQMIAESELTKTGHTVAVKAADNAKQITLPAAAASLTKDAVLSISRGGLDMQIPGSVLEQLKTGLTAEQLKNAVFMIQAAELNGDQVAAALAPSAGKRADTSVTAAGGAFDFGLSITTKDGTTVRPSAFAEPVTLKLKLNADADPAITGVYYIDDKGDMSYVDGKAEGGYLTVQVSHFSKYAVLAYNRSYADVPASHWAASAIASMTAKQVVTGTGEHSFSPSAKVTRAEFAAFLARRLGLTASGAASFGDVPASKWYADEIAAAAAAGIVSGATATTFEPERPISRQEMAVMLMKAYSYKNNQPPASGEGERPFTDYNSIAAWARPYVKAAQGLGLIQGEGGAFAPQRQATRAEAVQMIAKL